VERGQARDPILSEALASVASGAWGDVRDLLTSREPEVCLQPELITLLGEAYLRTHAPREACSWLDRTVPELRRAGDRVAVRKATNLSGVARFELGELDDAEHAFRDAFTLGRLDGDDLLLARATNNLGLIANVRGEHAEAIALYRMAIPSYQRLGQPRGLAETYHNLAITFRDLADLERAEDCEWRAMEFGRQASDDRLVAMAETGLAELQLLRGDAAIAEARARRGAVAFERLGDAQGEANALRIVGVAATALEKYATADEALDRAVSLASERGYALVEGESRLARAQLALARGDLAGARGDAEAALEIFERLGSTSEAWTLREWIETRLKAEEPKE
jgi:tetratricopeptide (TPR) repeat protein